MEILSLEPIVLGLVLAVIALVLGGTVWSRVPPMPTSTKARRAMLDLVADARPGVIYELGAGWGGLAAALARRFPDARVVAIELSPLPWAVCRLRVLLFGPANLRVRWGNALKADLRDADLVACFLCPEVMAPLDSKLADSLKPGTLVLSNAFALPGWQPVDQVRLNDLHRSPIYLYRR